MARQPQQQHSAAPPPGANAAMSMSAAGRAALAVREGLGGQPGNEGGAYNDLADNCTVGIGTVGIGTVGIGTVGIGTVGIGTVGIGTLVHYGPCTPKELSRPANPAQNRADFDARIRSVEDAVRHAVPHRPLNQNQYDALVSGGYNSGRGMRGAFVQADRGNDSGVADEMRRNVLIHRHNAQGQPIGPPIVSRGSTNRRADEVAQYNRPVPRPPLRGRR